jgi:hypothetical protein
MNLTCVMHGSNGHILSDYHNSDANTTQDTGEWGRVDDSGRAKGAGSRPVVVAACRQVRLLAKKVTDVDGRTSGLTEAVHAAKGSWLSKKRQNSSFFQLY